MSIITRTKQPTVTFVVYLVVTSLLPPALSAYDGVTSALGSGRQYGAGRLQKTGVVAPPLYKTRGSFTSSLYVRPPLRASRNIPSGSRGFIKDTANTFRTFQVRKGLTQKRSKTRQSDKQEQLFSVLTEASAKQRKNDPKGLLLELRVVNDALNLMSRRQATSRCQEVSCFSRKISAKPMERMSVPSDVRYRFRDKRLESKAVSGEHRPLKEYVWNENFPATDLPLIDFKDGDAILNAALTGEESVLEYERFRELLKRTNASTIPDVVNDIRLFLQRLIKVMLNFLIQEAPLLFQKIVSQENVRIDDLDLEELIIFSEFLVELNRELDLERKKSKLERMPLTFGKRS